MRALKLSEDIRPVTDLKSHGADIIRQVESGRVVVLSRHGRAVAVVVSVEEYEDLQETAEHFALQRAVEEGEAELAAGKGIPHAEVKRKLAEWADEEK
jgi:prevent-host-death family protein